MEREWRDDEDCGEGVVEMKRKEIEVGCRRRLFLHKLWVLRWAQR